MALQLLSVKRESIGNSFPKVQFQENLRTPAIGDLFALNRHSGSSQFSFAQYNVDYSHHQVCINCRDYSDFRSRQFSNASPQRLRWTKQRNSLPSGVRHFCAIAVQATGHFPDTDSDRGQIRVNYPIGRNHAAFRCATIPPTSSIYPRGPKTGVHFTLQSGPPAKTRVSQQD